MRSPRDRVAELIAREIRSYVRFKDYGSLKIRIGQFLEHYDEDCVVAVCLALVQESKRDFSLFTTFHMNRFVWMRDFLNVPDGCWKYHLWLEEEKRADDRLRDGIRLSLTYWIDVWADGEEAEDWKKVSLARESLAILERRYFLARSPENRIARFEHWVSPKTGELCGPKS